MLMEFYSHAWIYLAFMFASETFNESFVIRCFGKQSRARRQKCMEMKWKGRMREVLLKTNSSFSSAMYFIYFKNFLSCQQILPNLKSGKKRFLLLFLKNFICQNLIIHTAMRTEVSKYFQKFLLDTQCTIKCFQHILIENDLM